MNCDDVLSHGSHVEPGLTPKRLMGLTAMNYPNLFLTPSTATVASILSISRFRVSRFNAIGPGQLNTRVGP